VNKAFAENITKEAIQQLPLISFEGEIHIIDDPDKCLQATQQLRKHDFLGFDTETKPTFVKGQYNPTALIQLASADEAFLFRLNKLGYPKCLFDLMEDSAITKLGISILDDLKDLKKLRHFEPRGFIDLNHTAKELGIDHIGVRKLAAIFLEYRISKNKQVSNWENEELTPGQQRYAATDAWICLEIHNQLVRKGYL